MGQSYFGSMCGCEYENDQHKYNQLFDILFNPNLNKEKKETIALEYISKNKFSNKFNNEWDQAKLQAAMKYACENNKNK